MIRPWAYYLCDKAVASLRSAVGHAQKSSDDVSAKSEHDRPAAMDAVAVSIIVPSYNAGAFLADALRSVSDQTLRDFECLVIDDRSTDDGIAVARQFAEADARFRLIELAERCGVSTARNRGLGEARGRWVAVLDADDLFVPERLERLTRIGEEEEADLVIDDQLVTAFPRTSSNHRAFGFRARSFAISQEDFFAGSRLFRRSFPLGYMKPLMRREFLRRMKVAYDPAVDSGEDFLFYAELFAARPSCIATNFAAYIYRRRRGSASWSEQHLRSQAQLSDRVAAEFGDRLSSTSRRALAGRKRDFEAVTKAMPALTALRERGWARLVGLLVAQPGVASTVLRRLCTRALRLVV